MLRKEYKITHHHSNIDIENDYKDGWIVVKITPIQEVTIRYEYLLEREVKDENK